MKSAMIYRVMQRRQRLFAALENARQRGLLLHVRLQRGGPPIASRVLEVLEAGALLSWPAGDDLTWLRGGEPLWIELPGETPVRIRARARGVVWRETDAGHGPEPALSVALPLHPARGERRRMKRLNFEHDCEIRVGVAPLDRPDDSCEGVLLSISASGIGLRMPRRMAAGLQSLDRYVCTLELPGAADPFSLRLRPAHWQAQSDGGTARIGWAFDSTGSPDEAFELRRLERWLEDCTAVRCAVESPLGR